MLLIQSSWVIPITSLLIIMFLVLFRISLDDFRGKVTLFLTESILDVNVSLTGLTKAFVITVSIIAICVFIWARFYINESTNLYFFFSTLLIFVARILLLIIRSRFFIVFIGWEGLGITSFLLIIFYQNWFRFKGGVLTLLTNRIGDAVLIIRLSYWILTLPIRLITKSSSLIFRIVFLLLTLTKRAQAPFTRWLPAAIAAPTPVRALVHSSTLVTAGVWLIVRFGLINQVTIFMRVRFGFLTLLVARLAALVETDAKKIVALSTLSQLGLIYCSIIIGGVFLCFFHLVIHAFAKANLFLIVGNFIHSRFSQQDIRIISTGNERTIYFYRRLIRIIRLRGLAFTRGFFSKEMILIRGFRVVSSIIFPLIVFRIVSLTFSYCIKIILFLFKKPNLQTLSHHNKRLTSLIPRIFLRIARLIAGYFYRNNVIVTSLYKDMMLGRYWIFIRLAGVFILINLSPNTLVLLRRFFQSQKALLDSLTTRMLSYSKSVSKTIVRTLEGSYLKSTLGIFKALTIWGRGLIFFFIRILSIFIL